MKIKSKSMRKKSVAILAGIAIAGAVGASAASLGGLNGPAALGADSADVGSCDTDGIAVAYNTTYDATAGEYLLDSIDLSLVNASCDGQAFDLTVALQDFDNADALSQEQRTGNILLVVNPDTLAVDSMSIDTTLEDDGVTPLVITAEDVIGLAMTISGATVAV